MTKKKPNKPVPGDESTERMASTTPAPVQQAAPSDDVGECGERTCYYFGKTAPEHCKAFHAAAPAQPVGLSDALAALDHPLLRQLLGDIEDSNTPEATRLWSLVSAWSEVRDAAILAAKGAP